MGASVHRLVTGNASADDLMGAIDVLEIVLLVLEAAVLTLYVRNMRLGKPEAALSAQMLLRGAWRLRFWIGVVGAALAVPFILDVVNLGLSQRVIAGVAAVSVLVGGAVLRLAILGIGIKETPPLYRRSEWQRAHPRQVPWPCDDELRW
jgi:formate-dependent nitrite reductase membrane component NrfD